MINASVCPDITQFKKLAVGLLPSPDKDALLDHLEGCHACVQRLESLAENDTLVDLIRQAGTLSDRPAGETVARLIEHLRGLRPSAEAAPAQIRLVCPDCGKSLKVKTNLAGKKVKCPGCQAVIPVPRPQQNDKAPRSPAQGVGEALTKAPSNSGDGGSAAGPAQSASTDQHLCDFLAPAQSPDELGRLGPYRVLKVLGAGGMGVVFQAEDPQLQRLVALKAMLPSLAASESAKQRFLREARAAAAIKHDHIVTIHQVGEDRGVPFLAMEFLDGEPLDDRLKHRGKLPLAEVLRIGREMAEGLAAAHERGLIHRDIKPANVWLEASPGRKSGEYRVKILDFGLARAVGDEAQLTQQGAIVGTPAYMAPEQAQGKNLNPACDLFSLGCVLYRMATGEAPFRGTDMVSTLMAVATENPAPPVSLNLELPTELSDLIMQLLAKKPADRPESAKAVAETLEHMASDLHSPKTTKAKRQEKAKVPAAGSARRRIAVAVVALALLVPLSWWLSTFILRVETPTGTLIVEINDNDVEARFKNGKLILSGPDGKPRYTLTPSERDKQIEAGPYKIRVEGADGLVLDTPEFTLKKGGQVTVRVRMDQPVVQNKTPPRLDLDRKAVVPADALRRANIPESVLATLGGGDPKRAPAELIAVLGDGRFRLTDTSCFPAFSPDGALLAVPNEGEVFLFDANSGQLLRRFRGRAGRVFSVAFSPNGAMLAVGHDEIVRLWDPRSGVLLHDLSGHGRGWIVRVAFTPNNETVLSCSYDKTVRVWDVSTGRQAHVLSCKADVYSVAITPDGRLAVAGTVDGRVYGWSPETGAEQFVVLHAEVGPVYGLFVSVSADGQWLASGTNDKLKVWKIAGLVKKNAAPFFEKQTPANWLQFDKVSNKLWTGEIKGFTKQVCCWDPASGQLVTSVTLRRTETPWMDYALSPDGRTLAAFGADWDRVVQLYDTQTGKPRFPDPGHTREVLAVAFSPDGRWLASGSLDNTVRVWDLATGTTRHKLEGHTAVVVSVDFSRDGKLLASGSNDGMIALWDPVTGARVRLLNGHSRNDLSVRLSPDGKFVAAGTGDGGVRMWSARNGEEARMLKGLHEGPVRCLAFSADGQRLASGGQDGKLVITDLASGKVLQSFKRNTPIFSVEFGADGETVAVGYAHPEPVVRVWNLKDKDFVILKGHTHNVNSVSLRADGRLAVTASYDGSVRLWEIGATLPRNMVLGLGTVGEKLWFGALSPDGRYVATGNSNGTIYLFRLPGPEENIGAWLAARGSPPRGLSHEAWLQRVKGLYVGNLPDAVADRLRELNPGFDGQLSPVIEDGVVTHLDVVNAPVSDISPLKDMKLTSLGLHGTQVADLSPLKKMKLTSLNCNATKVSDLTPLKGMPLNHLDCANTPVTDLSPLKGMPLNTLNCASTPVSDLSPLKGMKLATLFCGGSQLTDAGLMPLQEMYSLRLLAIDYRTITDPGLAHLKKLTDLEQLNCTGARLTGEGLMHLKGMTKLHTLVLNNTEVTDAGLVHVKGLLALRGLHLQQTRVTDAGLEHLAGLKNLVELNLRGTGVTDKGVAKLKAALPKCSIGR